MKTSVVVGRFQIPELHEGHITLLKKAYDESDKNLIVILAITDDIPSLKNPYNVAVRKTIIEDSTLSNKYFVNTYASIKDYESDHVWSHHLDIIIDSLTDKQEVKIYHSRDSIKNHYFGKYPLVAVKCKGKLCSTEVRNKVISNSVYLNTKIRREIYLRGLSDGIKHANKVLGKEYEWIQKI